jgi:hypothetical protein
MRAVGNTVKDIYVCRAKELSFVDKNARAIFKRIKRPRPRRGDNLVRQHFEAGAGFDYAEPKPAVDRGFYKNDVLALLPVVVRDSQ